MILMFFSAELIAMLRESTSSRFRQPGYELSMRQLLYSRPIIIVAFYDKGVTLNIICFPTIAY